MGRGAGFDAAAPWFHGSPYELTELRAGGTITQDRALARVFSHKPSLVSADDEGRIRHNGRRAGLLYLIAEPVRRDDVTPVPGSTLAPGQEWLSARPLRLAPIERPAPAPAELLSPGEEAAPRRQLERARRAPTPAREGGGTP